MYTLPWRHLLAHLHGKLHTHAWRLGRGVADRRTQNAERRTQTVPALRSIAALPSADREAVGCRLSPQQRGVPEPSRPIGLGGY